MPGEVTTYLIGTKGLFQVGILEEASHGNDIWPCVHHDEEEDTCQVETRDVRVVLHDVVQQGRDLLHQNWIKGQEELKKQKRKQEAISLYLAFQSLYVKLCKYSMNDLFILIVT